MDRHALLTDLDRQWDIVVVGGGITGAGVFHLACRHGLTCLLLEQRDFAWGTSSRSGKLVHGGLRYIAQGQLRTSFHSVRQRERLLREYPGLVNPLGFAFAAPKGGWPMRLAVRMVLTFYDRMAGRRSRKYHRQAEFTRLAPGLLSQGGGFSYLDALTDDARLVLRVLKEGQRLGGTALNYMAVTELLRADDGDVVGVVAEDRQGGRTHEVRARVVINATGAWADDLRGKLGHPPKLRKLRGSHLIFPRERLPLDRAVGITSPADGRNMYVLPWEGATLLGTTDLDHEPPLDREPQISGAEGAYLLETINHWFPDAALTEADVIATQAGVRPVIGTGKKDPSRESREESILADHRMVTIGGGKLTTFAMMAEKALKAAGRWIPLTKLAPSHPQPDWVEHDDPALERLVGRHGADAAGVIALAPGPELERIAGTGFVWAELRWAARNELVVHLDDLMLRRTRLGLLLPDGGAAILHRVKAVVQGDLGWDDETWAREADAYRRVWRAAYSPALLSAAQ